MRQVPRHRWDVPRVLGRLAWRGCSTNEVGLSSADYRADFQQQSPVFDGLSSMRSNVSILDPSDLFLCNGLYRVADRGEALYRDTDHLTIAGAMLLRPLFEPLFN